MSLRLRFALTVLWVLAWAFLACAQTATVTAEVSIKHLANSAKRDNSNVVVWLTPAEAKPDFAPGQKGEYRIVQKNKEFHPHVLAVPLGTPVEFPNQDPFFHNVFSLYKGKKFDLGLYEAGSTRVVVFDKPGVSFVFCNIHPDMNAYVLALSTPYFSTSDRDGNIEIKDVPYGKYQIEVWYERAESNDLESLNHGVEIERPEVKLGNIEVADSPRYQPKHLNKSGKQYDPETAPY